MRYCEQSAVQELAWYTMRFGCSVCPVREPDQWAAPAASVAFGTGPRDH
jgi:hypothetical protein